MLRLFGDKLRTLRLTQQLSQSDIARRIESTRGHINNLEVGRKLPSLHMVIRIAACFSCPTDYLLRDSIAAQPIPPLNVRIHHNSGLSLFGQKLHRLRIAHGLTQVEMTTPLGLRTQAAISLLEHGLKLPSIDVVQRASNVFKVTTDYLLYEESTEDGE